MKLTRRQAEMLEAFDKGRVAFYDDEPYGFKLGNANIQNGQTISLTQHWGGYEWRTYRTLRKKGLV
jgi:hypothetical protein